MVMFGTTFIIGQSNVTFIWELFTGPGACIQMLPVSDPSLAFGLRSHTLIFVSVYELLQVCLFVFDFHNDAMYVLHVLQKYRG